MVLWLSIWRLPLLWQRRLPPLAIIGTGRAFRSITTSIRLTTICSDVGIAAGTSPRRAILPQAMSTSRTGTVTSLTARVSISNLRRSSLTKRYATSALARPSCSTPTRAGSFNQRLGAGDEIVSRPRVSRDIFCDLQAERCVRGDAAPVFRARELQYVRARANLGVA